MCKVELIQLQLIVTKEITDLTANKNFSYCGKLLELCRDRISNGNQCSKGNIEVYYKEKLQMQFSCCLSIVQFIRQKLYTRSETKTRYYFILMAMVYKHCILSNVSSLTGRTPVTPILLLSIYRESGQRETIDQYLQTKCLFQVQQDNIFPDKVITCIFNIANIIATYHYIPLLKY